MQVFKHNNSNKGASEGVFTVPVMQDKGLALAFQDESTRNRYLQLGQMASGFSQEDIQQHIDTGFTAPVENAARQNTQQRKNEVLLEDIERGASEGISVEETRARLQETVDFFNQSEQLRKFVPENFVDVMMQSENPLTRRVAGTRMQNLLIAAEAINAAHKAATTEGISETIDDIAMELTDVVITSPVSVLQRKKRVELTDQFISALAIEDPAEAKKEFDRVLTEARDMGFITDNRFYLADFMAMMEDGAGGFESRLQGMFATLDAVLTVPGVMPSAFLKGTKAAVGAVRRQERADAVGAVVDSVSDPARLAAITRPENTEFVRSVIDNARIVDDPAKTATNVATYEPSIYTSSFTRSAPLSAPQATAFRVWEMESGELLKARKILEMSGDAINEEQFYTLARNLSENRKKLAAENGNLRYLDTTLNLDGLGNPVAFTHLGTSRGAAFKGPNGLRAAEQLAAKHNGEVVLEPGFQDQYRVIVRENIALGEFDGQWRLDLNRATDVDELGTGLIAQIGSPGAQTDPMLNAVLKQSEAARLSVQTLDTEISKVIKRASGENLRAVNRIFDELSNGAEAGRPTYPTKSEFLEIFNKYNNRLPNDVEVALYLKLVERDNVTYFLKSNYLYRAAVERGVVMADINGDYRAVVQVASPNPEHMVYSEDLKRMVKASDLPEGSSVYRLQGDVYEGDAGPTDLWASTTSQTRPVYHTDLLGYNPGGSRLYRQGETQFYIKQNNERNLADGRVHQTAPNTFLTARTQKEGEAALSQIRNIWNAVHEAVGKIVVKTEDEFLNSLRGLEKNPDLNAAILANNKWMPDVYNVRTLIEFAEQSGLKFSKQADQIGMVGDGQALITNPDDLLSAFTAGQVMEMAPSLRFGGMRKDVPLRGYGGDELRRFNQTEAIQRSFTSAMANNSTMAYQIQAIAGLVKAAKAANVVENIGEIAGKTFRQKVADMKINTSTREGKKLELERQKIMARMARTDYALSGWNNMVRSLGDWLYDGKWKGGRRVAYSIYDKDPINAMRGFTFDAYLGAFAIDQFYVQASQVVNIIGIAGPARALPAAAAYAPVRFALANGNEAVMRRTATAISKVLNTSEETAYQIIKNARDSGKISSINSVTDLQDFNPTVLKGLDKARQKSRLFYYEGEIVARITAHITASMEYTAKYGDDLTSQASRQWVMDRSDLLTQYMTSASRTKIEQFPFMQFMSWNMRVLEAMVSGSFAGGRKILNGKEKIRLASSWLFMWGLGGVGLGAFMDRLDHRYGIQMDNKFMELLRRGAVDTAIHTITGVETRLGERLAFGDGLVHMLEQWGDAKMLAFLAGPMGSVLGGVYDSVAKAVLYAELGAPEVALSKGVEVFRNIKTVNMSYNAYNAFLYGEFLTRSGRYVTGDITPYEAAAIAFGVPIDDVIGVFDLQKSLRDEGQYHRDMGKKFSTLYRDLYTELRRNGRTDRSDEILDAIGATWTLFKDEPGLRTQIEKYIDKDVRSDAARLLEDALRQHSGFREEFMRK